VPAPHGRRRRAGLAPLSARIKLRIGDTRVRKKVPLRELTTQWIALLLGAMPVGVLILLTHTGFVSGIAVNKL
jgi:hypothetical protein